MLMIDYHYRLFSVSNGTEAKTDNVIEFETVKKNKWENLNNLEAKTLIRGWQNRFKGDHLVYVQLN